MSAIQQLADGYPAVRPLPLILSGVADAEQVRAAMERGAWGYVIKGVSGTELVHAGRSIHHGERYVTPALAAKLSLSIRRNPPIP